MSNGNRREPRRLKRPRRKRWSARLFCPIHKCLMRVRRVLGQQQYRYCPVAGCKCSKKTKRTKLPRPRMPREEASPATAILQN